MTAHLHSIPPCETGDDDLRGVYYTSTVARLTADSLGRTEYVACPRTGQRLLRITVQGVSGPLVLEVTDDGAVALAVAMSKALVTR